MYSIIVYNVYSNETRILYGRIINSDVDVNVSLEILNYV